MSSPFGVPTISVEADTGPNTNERANPTSIYMGSLRPEASNSFLSAGPPRSPTGSFDGVTLHSRSGSLLSPNTKEKSHSDYDNDDSQELEEALKAEHGKESEINIPNNPFAFTPEILNRNLNPKSLAVFKACGGPEGFARGLWTNLETGLDEREGTLEGKVTIEDVMHQPKQHRDRANSSVSDASTIVPPDAAATKGGSAPSKFTPSAPSLRNPDEELGHPLPGPTAPFADRKRIFSDNRLPKKKGKTIWELMWEAYKDPFILVLTGAAVISLALGLYETFGVEHKPGEPAPVDWVEGVAIVVAICIVVIVSAGNDWQKERQFGKLNRKKEDRVVQAVRSGKVKDISVYDILVGDVLMLSQGDLIPADGIVIESNEIKCDESSATGESDQMKKTSAQEVYDRIANISVTKASSKLDPFIISGSKVLEGTGKYLVTSVGVNSSYGKIMMGVRQESEKTPLQVKLEGFAGAITKFGLGSAILLLLVLTLKFVAGLSSNTDTPTEKGSTFLDILIVAVTIIVVAVPEGLPLAVTLALAYATTRMLKDNNLVRVLRACETMGNATTVCSDKTGTLTQNKMTVVAGTIGKNASFAHSENKLAVNSIEKVFGALSQSSKSLLRESVVLNSTATDGEYSGVFNGSKTETALLSLVDDYIGIGKPLGVVRSQYQIKQIFPFDSARKCMGIVISNPSGYRLYVKGASEILLGECTSWVDNADSEDFTPQKLTEQDQAHFSDMITTYARKSLRTIALVYKDLPAWPPVGVEPTAETIDNENVKVNFADIFGDMTLFAIVGIQDPLRPGVPEAVEKCALAGVTVRMVTGDNVETAKAIAKECGIFDDSVSSEHIFMEGPIFRKLDEESMKAVIPKLRVLARSSPEDKRILVKALKEMGDIVAVTGDGTNDGPALKMADVGFSMGIAGTEVAKEASAIILMDDNFSSIVKAIMWGRAVNDAVQKFLQFQLTVNITAVLLTFVSSVASDDMSSVLTAVQLLWVNLIMDTFAALALATDAPTPAILDRKPAKKTDGLVTLRMWKMILGQAVLQLIVTFVLHFAGRQILGYETKEEIAELKTMVFNTFVWMQIFNEFNNRRLDNKFNILENIHKNHFFIGINILMFGGQVAIIFVGGRAFSIVPINGVQWAICVGLAFISIPWAVLIRCIPDSWAQKLWEVALRPWVNALGKGFNAIGRPFVKAARKMRKSKVTDEEK